MCHFSGVGPRVAVAVGLAGQGLGGGPRASVLGGVGGRGTGPRNGANFATSVVREQKEEKWRFLKDALWGGGGVLAWWTGG